MKATGVQALDPLPATRWQSVLRQFRPLLLAVVALLLVGLVCLELMATAASMLRGHARWIQASNNAIRSLDQFAHTCEVRHLRAHQSAMSVLLSYGEARRLALAAQADFAGAEVALLRADPKAQSAWLRLRVLRWSYALPGMDQAGRLWLDAERTVLELQDIAIQIEQHAAHHGCGEQATRFNLMVKVYAAEQRLSPLSNEFGDAFSAMHRRLQRGMGLLMLATSAVVLLVGLAMSRRAVRARQRAVAATASELAQRRRSVATLRQLLAQLQVQQGTGAGGTKGETEADVDDILRQVQHLSDRQRADHAALQSIFERSQDAFVSFGGDGRVDYVSPAFEALTRQPANVALGCDALSLLALLGADRSAGVRMLAAPSAADGNTPPWHVDLDGPSPRTLEVIPLQSGVDVQATVLCLRDVTRAHALDRMKSEFMTTAAHELRTPMASVFGFVELLRVRAMSDTRRAELLDIVHRQSRRMIAILDDLLDLSRLESTGRAALKPVRIDLQALAQEVASAHPCPDGREAPALQLGDGPRWVLADRDKLARVVDNLLSNAYKYSPDGGAVLVQLAERRTASGAMQIGLRVQDHGMGMTAAQLQRVGERFYRADASGNIPGTGLGISLVREILQLHGGTLEIHSEMGVGSRFTAWLPAAMPNA